ncbi:MAG TPA: hypothetical protein VHE30_10365 [Polyangiaceae bacterium]|nr:hypothetical protein [Polyangiaceae bacterium]
MRISRLIVLGSAAAALAFAVGTTTAKAGISLVYPPPPFGFPGGVSYPQLGANFWKWLVAQPVSTSPILDTTGAKCGSGQSGQIWFLAGAPSNDPVTRSCTVPYGKTIVFPIVNAAYFAFPTDPSDQRTEAFVRSQVTFVEQATNLRAEVDGIPVLAPKLYLERSKTISTTLPADNIYGLPAGQVLDPGADEGYYIGVQALTPGSHKIHFHGELPGGFVQEVTYDLTVR